MKMRKIITLVVAIMMLLSSTVVNSEDRVINFSGYTLDELIAIRTELEDEILSRIEYKNADMIYRGKYIVGRDIRAGQYIFTCVEASLGSSRPEGEVSLWRIDDQAAFEKNGSGKTNISVAYDLAPGNGLTLALEDGMLLEIVRCSGTLVECNQNWSMNN